MVEKQDKLAEIVERIQRRGVKLEILKDFLGENSKDALVQKFEAFLKIDENWTVICTKGVKKDKPRVAQSSEMHLVFADKFAREICNSRSELTFADKLLTLRPATDKAIEKLAKTVADSDFEF